MIEYTFKNYCKIQGLNFEDYAPPPYTFLEWLDKHPNYTHGDFNSELLYDAYVYSIQQLGYIICGDANYGIGVLKENKNMRKHIGYLVNGKFICLECINPEDTACKMFLVNILPYSQTCQECGKTVVQGNKAFPILFDW